MPRLRAAIGVYKIFRIYNIYHLNSCLSTKCNENIRCRLTCETIHTHTLLKCSKYTFFFLSQSNVYINCDQAAHVAATLGDTKKKRRIYCFSSPTVRLPKFQTMISRIVDFVRRQKINSPLMQMQITIFVLLLLGASFFFSLLR